MSWLCRTNGSTRRASITALHLTGKCWFMFKQFRRAPYCSDIADTNALARACWCEPKQAITAIHAGLYIFTPNQTRDLGTYLICLHIYGAATQVTSVWVHLTPNRQIFHACYSRLLFYLPKKHNSWRHERERPDTAYLMASFVRPPRLSAQKGWKFISIYKIQAFSFLWLLSYA